MALGINTNLMSLNTQRTLNKSQDALSQSIQRLSSGLRINGAKDDAAGLAVSERMNTQIRGLNVASRNANDAVSLVQTAESAMASIADNLQRMRELAVQSANATNSGSDRTALQQEVSQLSQEIDRIATQTQFNGISLMDGSFSGKKFQIGANEGQTIAMDTIDSSRTVDLGKYNGFKQSGLTVTSGADAGFDFTLTTTGASPTTKNIDLGTLKKDASVIAKAINNANVAGLVATANATEANGANTNATAVAGVTAGNATFTINGIGITVATVKNDTQNRANALQAINAASASTGVKAADTGSGLKLTAADGRNIAVSFAAGSTAAAAGNYGLDGVSGSTATGTFDVSYQAPDNIASIAFNGGFGATSINATSTVTSTGTALKDLDISTVGGANTALVSIDAALSSMNSRRAQLGAMQNRLSSTMSNIASASENLTAARSRITDTDFAQETASLSRAQILQQAGTAMLQQANSLPNQVVQLLRG